jgi:hypothetical protein
MRPLFWLPTVYGVSGSSAVIPIKRPFFSCSVPAIRKPDLSAKVDVRSQPLQALEHLLAASCFGKKLGAYSVSLSDRNLNELRAFVSIESRMTGANTCGAETTETTANPNTS